MKAFFTKSILRRLIGALTLSALLAVMACTVVATPSAYAAGMSPAADGKLINDTGKYLCVWHKQKDGSWKATHDMWNSDLK